MAVRSPDLWFADGTVILRAEDVLFRVYGGMLASKSSVFADMFQIPQPGGAETIEGCPVVDLHDSAYQLSHFLKTLHDAEYYTERTTNFDVVFSVLRLATKYEVSYFRRHTISIFSAIFPSDIDGWSQRFESTSGRMDVIRPHMAVQLLLVSGELRLSSMLPSIHYILATQALMDLLDGVITSDGRHLELPWNLKRACLLGRARLVSAYHSRLLSVLRSDPAELQSCNAGGSCKATTCAIATRLNLRFPQRSCALVRPGRTWFQNLSPGVHFCEPCTLRLVAQWDSEIKVIWNELPSYFELPPWGELPSEDAHTS